MKLFSLLLLQSLCLAASLLNLSPTKASSSSWTARRLKLGQLNMVATAPAETAIGGKDSETSRVKDFAVHSDGKLVDMHFSDGTAYTYHALWLRDACRDVNHVVANVGERQLTATAAMLETPEQLAVKSVDVSESGDVKIEWNSGLSMIDSIENTVQYSTFSSNFLRLYADVVAKPIKTNDKSHKKEEMEWLRPYTGYPDACAPKPSMINLWTNTDRKAGKFEFQRFQYSDAIAKNLDFMKTLLRDGAVLVDHVPECPDAAELLDFTYRTMGGLQKDPTRDEPNW